jgi:hypothetical protein
MQERIAMNMLRSIDDKNAVKCKCEGSDPPRYEHHTYQAMQSFREIAFGADLSAIFS